MTSFKGRDLEIYNRCPHGKRVEEQMQPDGLLVGVVICPCCGHLFESLTETKCVECR